MHRRTGMSSVGRRHGIEWLHLLERSPVALGYDPDHDAAPGLHLLDVRQDLFVHAILAGARTTTGMFSSMSAIGPCFISPAG